MIALDRYTQQQMAVLKASSYSKSTFAITPQELMRVVKKCQF